MHCPRFIYEIAVARTAAEFLGAEMALETYARNMLKDFPSITARFR